MQIMRFTPKQVRAGATRRRVPGYRARAASNPSRFGTGKKGASQARRAHAQERYNKWRNKHRGKLGGKIGSAISVLKGRGVGRKRPTNRKSERQLTVDGYNRAAAGMMKEVYKRDRKKILSRKPRRASAGVKPRTRRAGTRQILRPASRRPKATATRGPTKQFKPVRKRPVRASAPSNAWRAPKRGSRPVSLRKRRKAMPQRAKNVTRRKVTNRRGGTGPQRNWAKVTPLIRSAGKKYRGYRR